MRRYPEMGPTLVVAKGRFREALWSEDGSKLYGFEASGVYEFDVGRGATLNVDGSRKVFEVSDGLNGHS